MNFPLESLKAIINKHLLLDNDIIVDVIVATVLANRMKIDPTWLLIVGPPSSGKTEILRALKVLDNIYFLSTLTPSTLISGKTAKNGRDPSLIYQLNDKILVMKDFTTVLSMRSENQQEILAQLREVYDGELSKGFDTGEHKKEWSGHVGFIGACTPVYDKHYGVIGAMGDRFILFRCSNGDADKLGFIAIDLCGTELSFRNEIQIAVKKYFYQFNENYKPPQIIATEETKRMTASLAAACAQLRCPVDRDRYTREVTFTPEPEGPPRVAKQLWQLATGLAMAYGSHSIDESVYKVITKISRDLMPVKRRTIISHMWKQKLWQQTACWGNTKEIATAVGMPTRTTKRELEDLMIVGAVRRDRDGPGETAPYRWQLAEETVSRLDYTEMFDE